MLKQIPLIYYALSGLFNFVALSALGTFAFLKNPKSSVNRIFSVFTLTASGWGLFHFLWLSTLANSSLADFYLRTVMLFVIFMPATFTHLILTFLKIKHSRRINIINYIITFVIATTVYTPLYAKDMSSFLVFPYWLKPGPFFHLHLLHFIGNVVYSHLLMLQNIKHRSGILKNQIFYVFIGTAIGYTAGIFNYLPWYRVPVPPFLNPLVSVYVAFVTIAIVKFHLMDIKVAVTRAGIFMIVYVIVLGLPFWIGYTTKLWFQSTGLAVVLGIAGPSIYNYLRRKAEDRLLKEQKRYQRAITDLTKKIAEIRVLDDLFATETSTITKEVQAAFCAIYLKAEDYRSFQRKSVYPQDAKAGFPEFLPYDDNLITAFDIHKRPISSEEIVGHEKLNLDSGLVVPCFGKDGLLALIILGAKPNHEIYTSDDKLVFENHSYAASLAIENCMYWKTLEHQQRMHRIEEMHTFSYSLAHEIDNPMTIIVRGLEVLERDFAEYIPEPVLKRFLELIAMMREAAARVSTMVKAIQEFGQRASSDFTVVKMEKVIDTFISLYQAHFKMKGVVFTKELPTEPFPLIRGISQEIEQALFIFAKNAVQALQYCEEKRVHLKAEVINADWIRISLSDNGPGIEKEKLMDIFTAFYTSKASSEGTGMGLYNATQFIAQRHKGRIWAESEGPGKGSTFFIELPIPKDIKPEEIKEEKKKPQINKLT